jgi:hypothetical protein
LSGRKPDPDFSAASDPGVLKLGSPGLAGLIREVLARGSRVRLRAGGASMQPYLRDGDILIIGVPTRPLKIGDVAAFTAPPDGALLIHRLIGVRDGSLRFKGDGVRFVDPPIRAEDVLGIVLTVERAGRKVRFAGRKGRRFAAFASRHGLITAALAVRWRLKKIFAPERTGA